MSTSDGRDRRSLDALIERLEGATVLDPAIRRIGEVLDPVVGTGPLAEVLRGRWLGHPAHPLLTDLPIGFWTGSWLLDLVGGEQAEPVADAFVALGVLSVAPTAWTGWADWSQLPPAKQRVGLVHAGSITIATALYAASWVERRAGRRRSGIALGHGGAAIATLGGALGGYLAFAAADPRR